MRDYYSFVRSVRDGAGKERPSAEPLERKKVQDESSIEVIRL